MHGTQLLIDRNLEGAEHLGIARYLGAKSKVMLTHGHRAAAAGL